MANHKKLALELRSMLQEVFTLQLEGSAFPRLARAQGRVDGYMRALLDSGDISREDLLRLVAEERTAARGPATRELEPVEAIA